MLRTLRTLMNLPLRPRHAEQGNSVVKWTHHLPSKRWQRPGLHFSSTTPTGVKSYPQDIDDPPKRLVGVEAARGKRDTLKLGACEELTFQSRLLVAWDCLMRSKMKGHWRQVLEQSTAESWLSDIAKSIPTGVKKLLAGREPPTVADLEVLPWIGTGKAGVYGLLLKSTKASRSYKGYRLYIGSGGIQINGFKFRRQLRRSGKKSNFRRNHIRNKSLHRLRKRLHYFKRNSLRYFKRSRLTKKLGLQQQSKYVTLMIMGIGKYFKAEVSRMNHVAVLGDALFNVWLGAFGSGSQSTHPGLLEACPWVMKKTPYSGR